MMIPRWFASLYIWDRILIIAYLAFIVGLIIVLAVMSSAENRRKAARKLNTWAEKWEAFTSLLRDDEPYDGEWMDKLKYEYTRIHERRL